jgi:hypothetical protein
MSKTEGTMDELAIQIGYLVMGIGLLALAIYLLSNSPLLRWLVKVIGLAFWGVFTIGSVLFVIFNMYLPQGRYGFALLALIFGSVMYLPWFIFGLPELKKCFVEKRANKFALWE